MPPKDEPTFSQAPRIKSPPVSQIPKPPPSSSIGVKAPSRASTPRMSIPPTQPMPTEPETQEQDLLSLDHGSPPSSPPPSIMTKTTTPNGNGNTDGNADHVSPAADAHDSVLSDEDTSHELPDFDWDLLTHQFSAAMDECDSQEAEVLQKFKDLANYFTIWAAVSHDSDRERAVKRFKTREAHIGHSEEEFAKKREHLQKVVRAFESAMELLKGT